ncbi:hypothetical protein HNP77_001887 [Treponema rectale]|uniref:Uncharacterized protein n=1 Tax=Treponema rectale TaxID=744512 RepID=A0A840SFJ6_9SPIR|nr:hypothetical protein [Treponema rectale]MBB5219505.1 hypothetical protein [Treponema rectale]
MTLNTRNRILIFINCITIVFFILNLIFYFVCAAKGLIRFPDSKVVRDVYILGLNKLFTPSITAVCLSILMFSFAAALESILILRIFEKTQALEVIFFMVFICSCFAEQSRILLAAMPSVQGNRLTFEIVTRLVVASRILAPLSLFFSTVFFEWDQRQNILRNVLIMVLVSATLGVYYPLNTEIRTSILTLGWGFPSVLATVRIVFVLGAVSSLIYYSVVKGSSDYIRILVGLIVLSSGYFFLCGADNYVIFIAGTALFAFGSFRYMKGLHHLYKWR